jgi:hypothetical protein
MIKFCEFYRRCFAQILPDLSATASQSVALKDAPQKDKEDEKPQPQSGINFVAYNFRS